MVAWAGQPGTSREGQLGLIAMDPVLGLWGIETAPPDGGAEMAPDSAVLPPLPPANAAPVAAVVGLLGAARPPRRRGGGIPKDTPFCLTTTTKPGGIRS